MRIGLFLAVTLLWCAVPLAAEAIPLPGRDVTLDAAVRRAAIVAVVELVDVGQRDLGAPGQSHFGAARARVLRTLRGRASRELVFAYTVQAIPADIAEEEPRAGGTFVLLLARTRAGLRAIKWVSISEEDLVRAAVRRRV